MRAARMTMALAEEVAGLASRRVYNPQIAEVSTKLGALVAVMWELMYPTTMQGMDSLHANGWFSTLSSMDCRHSNGRVVRIHLNTTVYRKLVMPIPELSKDAEALYESMKNLENERTQFKSTLESLLRSVTTVAKAAEMFPELKDLFPTDRSSPKANLVPIDQINQVKAILQANQPKETK